MLFFACSFPPALDGLKILLGVRPRFSIPPLTLLVRTSRACFVKNFRISPLKTKACCDFDLNSYLQWVALEFRHFDILQCVRHNKRPS